MEKFGVDITFSENGVLTATVYSQNDGSIKTEGDHRYILDLSIKQAITLATCIEKGLKNEGNGIS